jgi:hypothetical protein
MIPLLFILVVMAVSIMVSVQTSEAITWFTYYKGCVAGLLVSGVILEIWIQRKRAKERQKKEK